MTPPRAGALALLDSLADQLDAMPDGASAAEELREARAELAQEAHEGAPGAPPAACGATRGRLACDRPPHPGQDHSWQTAVLRQRLREYEADATIRLPQARRALAAAEAKVRRYEGEIIALRAEAPRPRFRRRTPDRG